MLVTQRHSLHFSFTLRCIQNLIVNSNTISCRIHQKLSFLLQLFIKSCLHYRRLQCALATKKNMYNKIFFSWQKSKAPLKYTYYFLMTKTSTVQWDCEPEPCYVMFQHLHHKQAKYFILHHNLLQCKIKVP